MLRPDLILDDIRGVHTVIERRSHLARAKKDSAAEILEDTKSGDRPGVYTTWPWPSFKATQLITKGSEHGIDSAMQLLDSAVEQQVGNAARNMVEAGIPPQDVKAWRDAVRRDVIRKLGPVDRAVSHGIRHGQSLTVRLKLFATATIVLDISASTIEVIAAPPGQRRRLAAYHAGRIAGGFAGATGGGMVGAKFGSRFGVAGGIVGGLVGAAIGGLTGAWIGKKSFVFIHDKIWPPGKTSVKVVRH